MPRFLPGMSVALLRGRGDVTTASCFHTPPTVRASITGDGLVLLDIRDGRLFAANAIGAEIWQLAQAGRTVTEIASDLAGRYCILADIAQRDVGAFLTALVSRGLLAEEPAA
jgi:hypothetical protein